MKKSSRQFLRRSCSLLLAFVLCVLNFPLPAQAKSGDTVVLQASSLDDASEILSLDGQEPSELSDYPADVYGESDKQPFLLSRQDELVFLARSEYYNNTVTAEYYQMDNISMDITKQENNNYILGGTNIVTAEQFEKKTDDWATAYDGLQNPQSIGIDRNGTGRKEYIATIGKKGEYLYLYIQNAKTGAVDSYTLGQTWLHDIAWRADNHMAITAGDYDGDGKDSIIVFVSGTGDNVCLWEYIYNPSVDAWGRTKILNFSSVLKETSFTQANSTETWKPTVSLTTGDFNGDGRDQLAFAAGYYDLGDTKTGYTGEADNLERFATCIGIMDRYPQTWVRNPLQWMYDVASESTSYSNGEYTYPVQLMHGVVIAAGDVNNDGIDEIVAAGYTGYTPETHQTAYPRAIYDSNHNLIKVASIGEFDNKYACSVIYKSGNAYARTGIFRIDMPRAMEYTWKKYCNDQYKSFSKLSIACGRTSGNNAPADVFINGAIYQFTELTPELKYTPAVFGEDDLVHGSGDSDKLSYNNWVRNVAVGNFNGNDVGREQFVFTFWARDEDGRYTALAGSISGVNYKNTTDDQGNIIAYGEPKNYGCNLTPDAILNAYTLDSGLINSPGLIDYWNWACRLSKQSGDSTVFAVPVAVDIDNDGVIGRFNKNGYVYTDPEVLAVLEAAPYFAEIEEAGGYENGPETFYSIGTSFGTGTSRSKGSSFEVGVAAEISGGALKAGLEAGYTKDWSHTYETSYTVSNTSTFSAYSEDIVVISRVPVLVYTYDIQRSDGTWIENGMSVRVPLTPCYYILGIDEYNEFVDEYNDLVGGNSLYRMNKIVRGVDLPLDHEGNPDKYWSNWADAKEGGMKLSNSDYALAYTSSSVTSEFSVETAETESEDVSHGFHFGMTLQVGGDFMFGEAWAGAYANMDFSESTGHSTTNVNTTTTGGTVPNIKASAVEGLTVAEVKSSYGFKWNFGKWTRTLVQNGGKVPFYGYITFNDNNAPVKRRALPPQISDWTENVDEGYAAFSFPDLTAALDDVLTVTKVSGDSKITYDSSAKAIKVAAGLAAGSYPAVFNISNGLTGRDTTFTFILKVVAKTGKWMHNANGWWYQRPDGTYPKNQWEKIDGKWYHFDAKGYMQTEWLKLSGKWYYLGTNGVMVTGWKQISSKWYYFNDSGIMITGWKKISNKWYYFNDSGVMISGWKQISGKWYYFNDSGVMQTGWQKIAKKWYYFNTGGDMVTGWKTISGKTYFFKSGGEMAASEWCGGYYLNADGTWTYKYKATWRQNAKGWWYGDESGWYAKNCTITIDDKSYTFNASGYWVK